MKELKEYLGQIRDPRMDHKKLHLLEDIGLLVLIAVICGCESWETIEEFGKNKKDFLRKYLTLTTWLQLEPLMIFNFTLVFSGLPKSCKMFDLVEEIPQSGGFYHGKIKRNKSDVYSIRIN